MPFARVVVNLPAVSGEFDYSIPPELAGKVGHGQLVTVPFGGQNVQGVVIDLPDQPSVPQVKPLLSMLDATPVLSVAQIQFARQLAYDTLNPLASIVDLMIPPGLSQQVDTQYFIREMRAGAQETITVSNVQARLLDLLNQRGSLRARQIDRHFGPVDWRKTAERLVKLGVLAKESVLMPPSVRAKYVRTAQLAVSPDIAKYMIMDLGKTEATRERRKKAMEFLMREPEAVNVSWVYAESGCTLDDLEELSERGLIFLRENEIFRDPVENMERRSPILAGQAPDLTEEQKVTWDAIYSMFEHRAEGRPQLPILLHGVTGSGKTELYLRATNEAIRRGRQAIILVPEIALTPQMVRRFVARFPGQVGILHSRLSEGERYDTWRRARSGSLKVIIGARSALFAPLPHVGLIVVDECHEGSYYQAEPPFYHAVDAAVTYGKICGAVVLMGSATPPVEMVRKSRGGQIQLLELKRRVIPQRGTHPLMSGLPPVSVVDMRNELKAGNRGIFSRELAESLAETLERGEQAILYLNRRGTATYIFCRDCGYVAKCPKCDIPLTLHTDGRDSLLCHHCGYTRQAPKGCPNCRSTQIRAFGLGSEKVEDEVHALLPNARTLRWDWDTTREKDSHEMILTHFSNHQADVLVGTQMLAKGLDLPLVTLVGVVLADVGLNLPDPFAGERIFQLLTQVSGRAGRSVRGGKVVLQTFMPESPVIQAAAGHDYAAFYEMEMANRRKLGYPPYARLARLEFRHIKAEEAEKQALILSQALRNRLGQGVDIEMIGPAPCFFSKLGDFYRWQIILRGSDPAAFLRGHLPDGWRVEVSPASLL
jgi:primosomal protein N' (replication factor Y)